MTDRFALAASLVMTGFDGEEWQRAPFGGFILFARNVPSLDAARALTDRLRERTALVGIDQEGGRVARIRDGIEELPPMMAFGAVGSVDLARRAGEQLGFDLRRAGCTLDFAPVLDLALHARNTVIGARAFADDPNEVAALAGAFLEGMSAAGTIGVVKHFPGHGSTETDSHLGLPRVADAIEHLRARDIAPFRALAPVAPAVMAGHVSYDALDSGVPASLSPRMLSGLLRGELGFTGPCFTDALEMGAIVERYGIAEAAALAIRAGADCAVIGHGVEEALEAIACIERDLERGVLPESRAREAAARLERLRERAMPPLDIGTPTPHPGVGREAARRAVTLLRGVAHADPTSSIVVSFEGATYEGAQGALHAVPSLVAQAPALAQHALPISPTSDEVARALEVIARSGRRAIVVMRRAHLETSQRDAIAAILARAPDALLVSAREPYDGALFPQARHIVAIYGDNAVCLAGLADVLFGGSQPEGTLPVAI